MVYFVGAGSGAKDLITVRGANLLGRVDVIIYAGSLVNPELLTYGKEGCQIHDSSKMTLEQVIEVMEQTDRQGQDLVRLHTGDPCLYGAIKEQMDQLEARGLPYEVCPGVSSFCGAAAAMNLEYTLPGISQSVIITRMEGRTPVPALEQIKSFAAHQSTMVIFLSAGMLQQLAKQLILGGYAPDTPAAIVYKATWPDQQVIICTVATLAQAGKEAGIDRTALILVGKVVGATGYDRSKLYDPSFTTGLRKGVDG